MYYRLKPGYVLRGWEKMPWALVHRPENYVQVLKQEEFQTLLFCDGVTDSGVEYLSDVMRTLLYKYEKEGIIEKTADRLPLKEDQFYQYFHNRYVNYIFWSVTGRCNFRCCHCYMNAPKGMLGELSNEEAICLIGQMAQCGVLRVDITGGEPFVRSDFWQLIDCILHHKMVIGRVYTNGWFLNEKVLDEFEKRGMKPEFSISFDGIGWHDWMRGVPGAEDAAINALMRCKERGFPTSVEMCIHKGNWKVLRETVNRMASLGVSEMKCAGVVDTELWEKYGEGNSLNFKEYMDTAIAYIPHFYEDGMPIDLQIGGAVHLYKGSARYKLAADRYGGSEKCKNQYLCGSARYACYITPEGRLLPCLPMTACKEQGLFPAIREQGLREGLSDSFYMRIVDSRVKDLLEVNSKCAACGFKYRCGGGCRASALVREGSLMGCDPEMCAFYEGGYENRIRKTVDYAIERYCISQKEIS